MAIVNPFDTIDQRLQSIEAQLQKLIDMPGPDPPSAEKFLTTDQVSKILSVSRVTLWNWDRAGILQSVRFGNLKRYRQSDIENFGRSNDGD